MSNQEIFQGFLSSLRETIGRAPDLDIHFRQTYEQARFGYVKEKCPLVLRLKCDDSDIVRSLGVNEYHKFPHQTRIPFVV